jgi:hypothetical protein
MPNDPDAPPLFHETFTEVYEHILDTPLAARDRRHLAEMLCILLGDLERSDALDIPGGFAETKASQLLGVEKMRRAIADAEPDLDEEARTRDFQRRIADAEDPTARRAVMKEWKAYILSLTERLKEGS